MHFWIGCAVWAYRDWVGDFYPPGTPQREFLERYVERLTAVEGNTTFWATPSAEQVARWAEALPERFRFCPKMSRRVTHEGMLAEGRHLAEGFLERVAGFGDHLGPVLVQLPPSYGPSALQDLTTFLDWWPHERARLALEVRHRGWWMDGPAAALAELLGGAGAGRVLLDTRPIYRADDDAQVDSERKKPDVPVAPTLTADFTMIRFIAHPDVAQTTPFLEQWADQLTAWLEEDVEVFYFSHCPIEDHSPGFARQLQHALEARGAPVPPLPWDDLPPPPEQLGLF